MSVMKAMGYIVIAFLSASCSSSTAGTTPATPMASANSIRETELAEVSHLNALDAIQRLRPNWLRARGPSTFNRQQAAGIKVYVDGSLYGPPDELRRIRASDIEEARYLDPRQATTRFGTDHGDGAILVTTKRG